MNREQVHLTVEHVKRLKRAATFQSRQLVGVIAGLVGDLLNSHPTPHCVDLLDGTIMWVDPTDEEMKFAGLIDLDRDVLADLRTRDEAATTSAEKILVRDTLLKMAKQSSHHVHQVAAYIEMNRVAWFDLKGQAIWWLEVEELKGENRGSNAEEYNVTS